MATKGNKKLRENKEGNLVSRGMVIVKTEWNAGIVDELEKGCKKILKEKNITFKTLVVPGAVEIPFAVKAHSQSVSDTSELPDAYIALGCVIRGDTPHFDYVCKAVTDGIVQLNLQLSSPVIFGVLTVENEKQAKERIGGKHGHKGEEAALTALAMAKLVQSILSAEKH